MNISIKQLIANGFKFPTILFQAYNYVLLLVGTFAGLLFFDYDTSPGPYPEDPALQLFISIFNPYLVMTFPLLLKSVIVIWDKKYETELLQRYKRDLMIGFGGILFCGTVQLIILSFFGNSPTVFYLSFVLFNGTAMLFLVFFAAEPSNHCKYSKPIQDHNIILWCTLSLHFILSIIALLTLRFTQNDKILLGIAVAYHVYYFSIFAITTIELLVIGKGDIVLNEKDGVPQKMTNGKYEKLENEAKNEARSFCGYTAKKLLSKKMVDETTNMEM